MNGLLKLALGVDWISEKFGILASWTVLFAALISAANAFVRYGFNWSSNSFTEIQWYLFAYKATHHSKKHLAELMKIKNCCALR